MPARRDTDPKIDVVVVRHFPILRAAGRVIECADQHAETVPWKPVPGTGESAARGRRPTGTGQHSARVSHASGRASMVRPLPSSPRLTPNKKASPGHGLALLK